MIILGKRKESAGKQPRIDKKTLVISVLPPSANRTRILLSEVRGYSSDDPPVSRLELMSQQSTAKQFLLRKGRFQVLPLLKGR